jgi:hypothetical protein
MTLTADEFIRRFLLHVLPKGFTAFDITACSPAPAARPMSLVSGNCSRCRRQLSRLNRLNQPIQPIQGHPVRAAAGA